MPIHPDADLVHCGLCGTRLDPDSGSKGGARPGRYLHFVTERLWVHTCAGCRTRYVAACAKRTATISEPVG